MNYNYKAEIVEDIKSAVSYDPELEREEHESDDDYADRLYEALIVSGVTGNESGSYAYNSTEAMGFVADNWDLMAEAYDQMDPEAKIADFDPETADVIIRCYLLGEAIAEYINSEC